MEGRKRDNKVPRLRYILAIVVMLVAVGAGSLLLLNKPKVSLDTSALPTKEITDSSSFTLISTGDIGLVRDINYKILQANDPNLPFSKIAGYTKNADLTITNLEGPLIQNCPVSLTGFTFCGEAENVSGLAFAGIDAASLANNHTTNYGLEGLSETAELLKTNGIRPFGLDGQIEYINLKGKKIALVGFVELGTNWAGLNNATSENVSKLAREASGSSDIVVTAFHWGNEYTRKPTESQVSLAHIAVDNGADLVLGNHPHWIQDSEIYKGVFITYAQGNTIFDQDWSQETKEGVLYKFEFRNGKFTKIDEKFTIIENNFQPRFATDEETVIIRSKLNSK